MRPGTQIEVFVRVREYVLERLLADKIRVRVEPDGDGQPQPAVYYYHAQNRRWYRKIADYHPKSGRARFRFGPKRQTLYRNVLVWMWVHRRQPENSDRVDHQDGNRFNDLPENLGAMDAVESHRQGYDVQMDNAVKRVGAWFGYIAVNGREPDHELSPAEVAQYA